MPRAGALPLEREGGSQLTGTEKSLGRHPAGGVVGWGGERRGESQRGCRVTEGFFFFFNLF